MSNSQSSASSGIGLFSLLGVVFIVLKLCDVINWSWWWVLSPLWGPFAVLLAILAVVAVVLVTGAALEALLKR